MIAPVEVFRAAQRLEFDPAQLAAFCERSQIVDLSLFGSVLRDDFQPESDVDVLVTFAPDTHHGLFALADMEAELSGIFGRKVDLLTRRSVEESDNWIRRQEILGTAVRLAGMDMPGLVHGV